jgi:hypothetical protein
MVPVMANLPDCRMMEMKPIFNQCGLDFFGPMTVKHGKYEGRKRWGLLLTCLTVRAVHLELVTSLESDAFILAPRRFIAHRGAPDDIFCDNGTNFVGAHRELGEAVSNLNSSDKLFTLLARKSIQWHFLPPKAPHMGGAWESLVKSVKRALRAVLETRCVREDTLHTVMCEVERVLNSRPLTYVGSDDDALKPLTPNHSLLHSSQSISVPVETSDCDFTSRKRWRQSQVITDHFWRRWRKEYLPTLSPRAKWKGEVPNLKVDDVVLIVDNCAPRGQWKLARIVEIMPGSDGRVRVAKVKTSSGYLTRPVSQLCLLEGDK